MDKQKGNSGNGKDTSHIHCEGIVNSTSLIVKKKSHLEKVQRSMEEKKKKKQVNKMEIMSDMVNT